MNINDTKICMLPVSVLETNKGQVEGLPKNPRFIRDARYEKLKKSIADAPEMLHLRELLVFPLGDKYVIVGGNMRYRACCDLGYTEVPCKVLPEDTPVEKLREYAVKDNNGFGQDDWDALANEWDEEELRNWGMEFPTEWGIEDEDDNGDGGGQTNTNEFKYESQFGVIVMCGSEEDQERVYNKLTGEGYSCKVVSV
jgi:hypothetical protein